MRCCLPTRIHACSSKAHRRIVCRERSSSWSSSSTFDCYVYLRPTTTTTTTTTSTSPLGPVRPSDTTPTPVAAGWKLMQGVDCVSTLGSLLRIGETHGCAVSAVLLSLLADMTNYFTAVLTMSHGRCTSRRVIACMCAFVGEDLDDEGKPKAFDSWSVAQCQVSQLVCLFCLGTRLETYILDCVCV